MNDIICGECPYEDHGCMIKFIEILKQHCMCKTCLIKSMCKVLCEDRENMFIDLPDWIKNRLEEIYHFHRYKGEKEYNKLMVELLELVKEADIEANYEGY